MYCTILQPRGLSYFGLCLRGILGFYFIYYLVMLRSILFWFVHENTGTFLRCFLLVQHLDYLYLIIYLCHLACGVKMVSVIFAAPPFGPDAVSVV
jgi:hypothetical protein